ncbi:MAG: hypothetical protein LBK99_07540, partial [Opitutaceae bacterium]|nr:hypothetical protein [Opitutaceae bacterium]
MHLTILHRPGAGSKWRGRPARSGGGTGFQPVIPGKVSAPPAPPATPATPVAGRFWTFTDFDAIHRESLNVLPLDYCNLRTRSAAGWQHWQRDLYFQTANKTLWKAHGYDSPPWFWAMQFKKNLADTRFGHDTGFCCEYEFDASSMPTASSNPSVSSSPDIHPPSSSSSFPPP